MITSLKTDFALYRRLLGYVLPYWRIFLLSAFSLVVLAITDPAVPALMQPLFNGAFFEKDPEAVAMVPFLLVALFVVRGITNYVGQITMHWVGDKIVTDMRVEMFKRSIDYPVSFFDGARSGNFMSCFTYDVTQIKDASTRAVMILIRDSLSVIGLFAWMFYINWLLALICVTGAPIVGIIMAIIRQRLRKMGRRIQETMGNIHHVLNECFSAQKIIKLHGGQQTEYRRFHEVVESHRRFNMKFIMAARATGPVLQIILVSILAYIIHITTHQASANPLLAGDFVSFFVAAAMLLAPLKRLASINEHLQKALAACEKVFALLDMDIEQSSGHKKLHNVHGKIAFRNVSYRYPGAAENALSDITLDIKSGDTIALVGESGSGKSTLVNLLPRFYEPQAGAIYYDDIDIRQLSRKSLRQNIAYVSQEIILFNDTIRNNIAYGELQGASDEAIQAAVEAAYADDFISGTSENLGTVIGEDGMLLSGGQRQRLAIARALLKDARLLILDEATSSLDTRSEHHIQLALETLKQNRTCLIIAHRLSTIKNADRIIVLHKGRIVEQGRHAELLKLDGHYAHLNQMQFYHGEDAKRHGA